MDCGICLEKIEKDNIEYLKCSHFLCKNCFDRLRQNSCPYCRTEFTKDKSNICKEVTNNYYQQVDNILPNSYLQDIYRDNFTHDIIHYNRRQVKTKFLNRERSNSESSFVSNRDRVTPERRKKKWKKRRNVIEV